MGKPPALAGPVPDQEMKVESPEERISECVVLAPSESGRYQLPRQWIPKEGDRRGFAVASVLQESFRAEGKGKLDIQKSREYKRVSDNLAPAGVGDPCGRFIGPSSFQLARDVISQLLPNQATLLTHPEEAQKPLLLLPEKGIQMEIDPSAVLRAGGYELVTWLKPGEGTEVVVRFETKGKEVPSVVYEAIDKSCLEQARTMLRSNLEKEIERCYEQQKAEAAKSKAEGIPAQKVKESLSAFEEHFVKSDLLEGLTEVEWRAEPNEVGEKKIPTYSWNLERKLITSEAQEAGALGAFVKQCQGLGFEAWMRKAEAMQERPRMIDTYMIYLAKVCATLDQVTQEEKQVEEKGVAPKESRKSCRAIAVVPKGVKSKLRSLSEEKKLTRESFRKVVGMVIDLARDLMNDHAPALDPQNANLAVMQTNFTLLAKHIKDLGELAYEEPNQSELKLDLPKGATALEELRGWIEIRLKDETEAKKKVDRQSPIAKLQPLVDALDALKEDRVKATAQQLKQVQELFRATVILRRPGTSSQLNNN